MLDVIDDVIFRLESIEDDLLYLAESSSISNYYKYAEMVEKLRKIGETLNELR